MGIAIDRERTPDTWAELARFKSENSMPKDAATATQWSIRSRADWVLVNGKWYTRQGIMR